MVYYIVVLAIMLYFTAVLFFGPQRRKKFLKLNGNVKIFDIGTTIGSHTGPGTVALFFWGQARG